MIPFEDSLFEREDIILQLLEFMQRSVKMLLCHFNLHSIAHITVRRLIYISYVYSLFYESILDI